MNVLVGFERSGIVREAFRARGHSAVSVDLAPAEDGSPHHLQADVFEMLCPTTWDLVIVHPECTYLSASGLHWNLRRPERAAKTDAALQVVARLLTWALEHPGVKFCLENPHGCISTRLPDLDARFTKQVIQPYQFGADASKATVLRLYNLAPLRPTKFVEGRLVEYPRGSGKMVRRWENQTDSGQNRLGPSEDRWLKRSRTYPGIAAAMADQFSR